MAGVIFGAPGIIAGGFATYFLRRATDSLPIWQSLGLCGVIYKAGLVILSHTCFFILLSGHPPSAAEKKRHLFGDSWAAFCAGIACVTAACLTALSALCALVSLKLWHWVLLITIPWLTPIPWIFLGHWILWTEMRARCPRDVSLGIRRL